MNSSSALATQSYCFLGARMRYFAAVLAGKTAVIRWTCVLTVIAIVLHVPSVASAGTVALSGIIQATYTPSGTLISETAFADGQPHIYRVGIFVKVSNLAPGESFGLVGYDMSLTGLGGSGPHGLSRTTLSTGIPGPLFPRPNYFRDAPTTNLIISASGQPLTNWYTSGQNGDLGVSFTDLIGIITAIDPASLNGLEDAQGQPATDPRLAIGTSAIGTRLGVLYLQWDGVTPSQLNFNSVLGALADVPGKKFFNANAISAPPLVFVPEPSSIALMGMAGVGLAFMARRVKIARRTE
jgi:hypothetical protein